PVTAAFKVKATGFDFRATTVHLKAGQKAPDEQKRRLEATELRGWFEQLQGANGEDADRVLLGDFNSTYGAEPETILEKDHLLTYLHTKTPTPTIMHFPEPIDQIVVGPGFGEVRADTFTVHGDYGELSKDAWRKIYSDHFPVTVDVVAATDEDPDATFAHGGDDRSLPPKNRPQVAFPGPKAAINAAAPAKGTWPPAVGTEVVVHSSERGSLQTAGKLARALPEGPGGWVVVEQPNGLRAIPWAAVAWISVP
ncbi:MAG: hypothetical protein JNK78_07855, partial [Planctomycetes bacterium]|nr:hypothetical protein [Planctomycetota bacterium]